MAHHKIMPTVCFALTLIPLASGGRAAEQQLAKEVLAATEVQGGLIVHVGCGDGKLTAALRANDSYIVHGLDSDPANVAAAREHIQSRGLYGDVFVEQLLVFTPGGSGNGCERFLAEVEFQRIGGILPIVVGFGV